MPDRMQAHRYRRAAIFSPRILWLMLLTLVVAISFNLVAEAQQQLTGEQFLKSVVDEHGPQYKQVDEAVEAFQRNQIAEAQQLLIKAAEANPELPPGNVMMAQLALAASQQQMAAKALEQAAIDSPDDPEPFVLFGQLALAGGRLTYADAMLDMGQERLANYTQNEKRNNLLQRRLLNGHAGVAEGRQQWEQADQYLSQWAELDPNNPNLLRRWAVVKFRLDRAKEAFGDFEKLHKLGGAPRPHINMAQLYESNGERGRAQRFIDEAIRYGKDEPETQEAAARWALGVGLYQKAREYARSALDLDAASADAKLIVGTVARALGEFDEAEQVFQEAAAASPTNFYARNNLALTLIEQEDESKRRLAAEHAQMNVRTFNNPRNRFGREAFATYAWVLYQLGKEAEAEQTIAQVVGAGQISPESAYYAAAILHGRNQTDVARQLLEQALQTNNVFIGRDAAEDLLNRISGLSDPS